MMVEAIAQTSGVSAFAEPKHPSSVHLNALYKDDTANPKDSVRRADGRRDFLSGSGYLDSSHDSDNMDSAVLDSKNLSFSSPALRIRFQTNQDTGRVAISVIDAETQEVIREIPPEQVQKVTEKLKNNLGLMFDSNL